MQTNRTITLVLAALAAISLHLVTATMLTSIRTAAADAVPRSEAQIVRDLRIRKATIIVRELYPQSGFEPHIPFFIDRHTAAGLSEDWWWSLAYGGANFSLKVGGKAPGGCRGPMDAKLPIPKAWRPTDLYSGTWRDSLLLDPRINIAVHVNECVYHHNRRGARGYRLMQTVFYPRSPRDWGGGRIWRTHKTHERVIQRAYADGRL